MIKNHLNQKWESILEECLTEYGFVTFRLTINRKTGVKSNGVILAITLEGRKDREFKIEFLVMKTLGESEENIRKYQIDQMFKTEAFVYNEVIKRFENLQSDLAPSDKFLFSLCYKSTNEYVLMEDLSMKNYVVKEQTETLDFNHMSLVLMELGRYHAFSFVLKLKNREDFNRICQELNKNFFSYPERCSKSFDTVLSKTLEVIVDDNIKNKLKMAAEGAMDKVKKLLTNNEHSVVCHGDLSSENIFFSLDENDEPSEIAMIDYQLSTVSSPVTDILYLLFTSSSTETIQQYEMLLDLYHDSMKLFLKKFQCLVDECYSKKQLKNDLVEYFPYVLVKTLFTIYENYSTGTMFNEKINELMQSLTNLNLI